MRLTTGFLCVALALSACGSSPEEDVAGWAREADERCKTAERAIAGRGAPKDLRDYFALVTRGTPDARGAIKEVLAIEVPEDARKRVEPARRAMRAVDGDLQALARLDESWPVTAFSGAFDDLEDHLEELAAAGKAAGLRTCGRPDANAAVVDALKAPVFEAGFGLYATDFVKRLKQLRRGAGTTPKTIEDALIGEASAIGSAQSELDGLRRPRWALTALDEYKDEVLRLRDVVGRARDPFLGAPPTAATARAQLPRVARAERRHFFAARRLLRTLRKGLESGGVPDAGDPA